MLIAGSDKYIVGFYLGRWNWSDTEAWQGISQKILATNHYLHVSHGASIYVYKTRVTLMISDVYNFHR